MRRRKSLLLMLVSLAAFVLIQSTTTPLAQLAGPSPNLLGSATFDVPFCEANGIELLMDVYYPDEWDGPVPLVIYVHGGGWRGGDKSGVTRWPLVSKILKQGYVFASLNYRLAPAHQFPAMIEDVKCGVRHFRAEATTYGIDPERIGVWGTSAGGHLVALMGTTDGSEGFEGDGGYAGISSRVQAVVDMYGPIDLPSMFAETPALMSAVFGAQNADAEILERASPHTWASPDDPPVLMIHGDQDEAVPLEQSEIFLESLQNVGVASELVVVENAGHGFGASGGTPSLSLEEISQRAFEFFDERLR